MIELGDITLNVGFAGPADGEPVLLLHGFPEYSGSMLEAFGELATHYRLIAPDQRGYNLSSKPFSIKSYTLETLAVDLVNLIGKIGYSKVHVISHDWGGVVGWELGTHHPEVIKSLVVMCAPHVEVFKKNILTNPRQLLKSYYIGLFQTPWLPETLLTFNSSYLLKRLVKMSGHPSITSGLHKAWLEPLAMKSMINWYRAIRYSLSRAKSKSLSSPTLLFWGQKDSYLDVAMANESIALCDQGQCKIIEGASHWILHTHSHILIPQIREFFSSHYKVD